MALLLAVVAVVGCSSELPSGELPSGELPSGASHSGSSSSSSGLASQAAPVSTGSFPANSASSAVDLGVVFAQHGGRFVFPLEDFGLSANATVESVQTSCECVAVQPISYDRSLSRDAWGLEIVVKPESHPAKVPQRLEVQLCIGLADGTEHDAAVRLLNTNPAAIAEGET